jgi:hypothetical protein
MEAVAHNPSFAKKAGVPQSVGKDFADADKGKKFASGGSMKQGVNLPKTNHGKSALFKEGGDTMAKTNPFMEMIAKKKAMAAGKKSEMPMKKGGMTKMATGGSVDVGNSKSMGSVRTAAPSKDGIASKGKTQGKQIVMSGNKGMKKGGKVC